MAENNSTPQEINIANPDSPLAFPNIPPQDDKCGDLTTSVLTSDNKLSEESNKFFNNFLKKAQGSMPNCETDSAKAAYVSLMGAAAMSYDKSSGCQNVAIQAALNQNLNTSINCTNNSLRSETALQTNQNNQATIEIVADRLTNSTINMDLNTQNTAEVLNVASASVQQEVAKQMQAGINNFQKQVQENYKKQNSLFKTENNGQPNQSLVSSTNQILNKSVDVVNQETIGRIVTENFQSANGTLKINAGLIEGVDLNISSEQVNEVLLTNIVNGVIGQIFEGTTIVDLSNTSEASSKNVTTESSSTGTIIIIVIVILLIAGGIGFYIYSRKKNPQKQLQKRNTDLKNEKQRLQKTYGTQTKNNRLQVVNKQLQQIQRNLGKTQTGSNRGPSQGQIYGYNPTPYKPPTYQGNPTPPPPSTYQGNPTPPPPPTY